MSFLVANTTDLPAVWVRGTGIREIGSSGLSSDQVLCFFVVLDLVSI